MLRILSSRSKVCAWRLGIERPAKELKKGSQAQGGDPERPQAVEDPQGPGRLRLAKAPLGVACGAASDFDKRGLQGSLGEAASASPQGMLSRAAEGGEDLVYFYFLIAIKYIKHKIYFFYLQWH